MSRGSRGSDKDDAWRQVPCGRCDRDAVAVDYVVARWVLVNAFEALLLEPLALVGGELLAALRCTPCGSGPSRSAGIGLC